MLLTIHNLPSNFRYMDVKGLLNEKCGLTDIILDNLVPEGKGKKVTVGLANDDDGALVTRKINGLILHGNQLYIEDRRRKTGEHDQPYRVSTVQEPRSIEPPLANSAMGMPMTGNVPVMWNYNVATPYMVQVPVEQNFAYGGYGGAPQAAYVQPQPVIPVDPDRRYSGFQDGIPQASAPRDQEPGAWGRPGRDQGPDNYRHPDRKRHLSPERLAVPKKRGSRWNENDAPKRREPSPPRQWSPDMNQDSRPPFRQPEAYTRDPNQYQPRESKPDYRTPEPEWENRWDAPKPRNERERDWGNGRNPNWEPETVKEWENRPNQNWRDEPIQNNEPADWEGAYSHVPERDGPEWFDRQPEKPRDKYRGDQFYERGPIEHESRLRQRGDRDGPRRPQNDNDAPRHLPSERDVPRRPQNDRDAPRRPLNDRDVSRRPPNDREAPRRPLNDRDDSRRFPHDRDVPRRPRDERDAPRHPLDDRDDSRHPPNDRDLSRRPLNERDHPRRPHGDMDREQGGPGASRSRSSSRKIPRRDEPLRRDLSRSNEDRRNLSQDLPGGVREKPDYWRQIADDYPDPKKTDYRREDFNASRREKGHISDMPRKPGMKEDRHRYPSKDRFPIDQTDFTRKKPQTLTNLINRDACNRGQATSMIAKLMLGIRGKIQFNSSINAFVFKQLKLCIKSRIDVILGEELSSDMDEVIKRYREKFPSSGDKVLLQQIQEKSSKEFEAMHDKRHSEMEMREVIKKEEDQETATVMPNNPSCETTASEAKPDVEPEEVKPEVKPKIPAVTSVEVVTPDVISKAEETVPAPQVIPPAPQLPKSTKGKPLNDKQVIKQMKLQRKWEYDNDDPYKLDDITKKALDEEINLLDKCFTEECSNPADQHEELILKRILNDCQNDFNKAVSLYITKRFLNIQTGLVIRMFAQGKLPKKVAVKQMLKKYRVEALKKNVKGNMYVINLSRFHDFDTLCKMEHAVIDGTPVTFKAMNLVGPPLKLSKNQILKMRRQRIESQIEKFDMDDFEETADYTEDVGGCTEDGDLDDWERDVKNEAFTEDDIGNIEDVKSEDFTQDINNEVFAEDVADAHTDDANNTDLLEDFNIGNFSTETNNEDYAEDNDIETDKFDVIDEVNIDDINEDDLEDF